MTVAYHFHPMTEEQASIIGSWQYEEPYSLYSMEGCDSSIKEMLEEEYYYAVDNENELVGYISFGDSARVPGGYAVGIYEDEQVIDIGLGLRPDYTGKGKGREFVTDAVNFLRKQGRGECVQLVVAAFNERAMKVYERAGFVRGISFTSKIGEQDYEFLAMRNCPQTK